MRKFILFLFIVLLLCTVGIFFGKNLLIKYILEDRLGQMNRAYVKIESVESHIFDNFIILNDVRVESHENKGQDFIQIKKLKTYYDIDYNHKKVELFDTEAIGLKVITPQDEGAMKRLRKSNAVEVEKQDILLDYLFQSGKNNIANSHEFQDIKNTFRNLDFNEEDLHINVDKIKENLEKIKEKYLKEKTTSYVVDTDSVLSNYLMKTYEDEVYDMLLRYREITREMEHRIQQDIEREDDIWEFHMNRVSIFSDIYGINFNGEIHNFNSRLSKNTEDISFKLFGEKGDTIGVLKGKLNLLHLELDANLEIPELDLVNISDFEKYLVDGVAFLKQDIHLDRDNLSIQGTFLGKRIRLAENPFSDKVNDLEVDYQYNTKNRKLYLKSKFLKNGIDEIEFY